MPPLRGSHLFICDGSRGSVASPLHHRAIVWRPCRGSELGGRAPAGPVFARGCPPLSTARQGNNEARRGERLRECRRSLNLSPVRGSGIVAGGKPAPAGATPG